MGSVFKKMVTRELPEGATISKAKSPRRRPGSKSDQDGTASPDNQEVLIASWRDKKGKLREGVLFTAADGSQRVRVYTDTYYAKFRNGDQLVQEVATGCRDKAAAKAMLAQLEIQAQRISSGVLTTAEINTVEQQRMDIQKHIGDYLEYLAHKRGKGKRLKVSKDHVRNVKRVLNRVVHECQFTMLRDITPEAVQQWVHRRLESTENQIAYRTINVHVVALKAFCNWAVSAKPRRLKTNPLERFGLLDAENNMTRPRRALTPDELRRLLVVAKLRPVAEYGRETKSVSPVDRPTNSKSRKTWTRKKLEWSEIEAAYERGRTVLQESPELLAELESLGRERALMYKTLVLTGLRKGELASIRIGDLRLDETPAWLSLRPEYEKSGQGSELPLRDDLAKELREWILDRQRTGQPRAGKRRANTIPLWKPTEAMSEEKLFAIPTGLNRIVDRDFEAAGIPKVDSRNRRVDVHALRHTFASLLSAAGVAPRTAQEALRHSEIGLTMKNYTDPKLLDVAGAVRALPALDLDSRPAGNEMRATGTESRMSTAQSTFSSVERTTSAAEDGGRLQNTNSCVEATTSAAEDGGRLRNMHSCVAPTVAPATVERGQNEQTPGGLGKIGEIVLSVVKDAENSEKTAEKPCFDRERVTRFELATYSLGSCHSTN